jgi:putative NADH-flavin reductase
MGTKILVLGATGGTGRAVVDAALERGWEVTVFARSPDKVGRTHERLRTVKGDVADRAALAAVLPGHDAVISALGQVRGSPPDLLRSAAAAVVAAMREAGVRRLILQSGAAVHVPGDPPPPLMQRMFVGALGLVMPALAEDTQGAADLVRASDLDWTLVRPMRLTDGAGGRPVQAAPVLALGMSSAIDRKDLAGFLLDQVVRPDFVRAAPMVTAG